MQGQPSDEAAMARATLTRSIKAEGSALGFDLVGVSAVQGPPHAESFAEWLRRGLHGEMAYMTRTAEQRLRPQELLPWARSVVSVGLNYNTPYTRAGAPEGLRGWVSRYAWGADYHQVMEERLDRLLAAIRQSAGSAIRGRAYVDAGPVLDREVGAGAGIGWYGKNTNLLSMAIGSLFVLGELFLDCELDCDEPMRDRCGQCRLCLDACPTNAFVGPYVLDARKCISYLTIELKGPIPLALRPLIGDHIFGCDLCQDVCPYNTRVRVTGERGFFPRAGLFAPELVPLLALTESAFRARFAGSPILRAKRRGLLRNVCVALGNLGQPEAVPALVRVLREEAEPMVRSHAAWALGRIREPGARAALAQVQASERDPAVAEEIRLALDEQGSAPAAAEV